MKVKAMNVMVTLKLGNIEGEGEDYGKAVDNLSDVIRQRIEDGDYYIQDWYDDGIEISAQEVKVEVRFAKPIDGMTSIVLRTLWEDPRGKRTNPLADNIDDILFNQFGITDEKYTYKIIGGADGIPRGLL